MTTLRTLTCEARTAHAGCRVAGCSFCRAIREAEAELALEDEAPNFEDGEWLCVLCGAALPNGSVNLCEKCQP